MDIALVEKWLLTDQCDLRASVEAAACCGFIVRFRFTFSFRGSSDPVGRSAIADEPLFYEVGPFLSKTHVESVGIDIISVTDNGNLLVGLL